jgi:hypothetical protein
MRDGVWPMKVRVTPAAVVCGLALFAALGSRTPAADDSRVTLLLAQSRAALGGAALDRRAIVRTDARLKQSGLTGTQSQWQEIGAPRFAESFVTEPLEGGDGYDGSVVWNRDRSGFVWVDGGEAGRAQEISAAFLGSDLLWSQNLGGATVTWGGTKTEKGVGYDSLVVSAPGSAAPFELWFDRTTHRPVRWTQTIGRDTTFATLEDYRRVAGIMIAYRSHFESSDGNSGDSTVTHVEVNPPDGDARLQKPASDVTDFSISGGASSTTVPFELIENHVYVNVMLNGKGPYRFIFDTGGANLVDPQVAREIGAVGKGSVQGEGVGATTESVRFANVDSLTVGKATLKRQLFGIAPVRAGVGMSGGRPIDGLIGFEVLARFITTFDYANDLVELALPGSAPPPANADLLPFVFHGQQPQFACTIAGVATQCTLDTGERASVTLFAPFMAEHPQVVPKTLTAVGVDGFGFGGPAMGKLGRVMLRIGNYDLPGVVADVTTQTKGAFAAPFVGGNVGGGVLKRFTLYLDYGTSTMALAPNASYAVRDSYERAGMFLLTKDGKKVVDDVRAGTPAQAAGIVKGDVITAIDGNDVAAESLDEVRLSFFGAPGTVLRLTLTDKAGAAKTVTLTLRDYV